MFLPGLLYLIAPLGLGVCCLVMALVIRELWRGYAVLLKRALRTPRFGISTLFGIVTVFALASAMMLPATMALDSPVVFVVGGLAAVVFAAAIVAVALFVVGDLRDNWGRERNRTHCGDSEKWEHITLKKQGEE